MDKEFRAQSSAWQSSGNHKFKVSKLKGGIAVMKTVLCKAGVRLDSALVTLGWLSFFVSFIFNDLTNIILLQTIARVLP